MPTPPATLLGMGRRYWYFLLGSWLFALDFDDILITAIMTMETRKRNARRLDRAAP